MFKLLQKLGKSLMIPIAVLPVAALLLRLGQGDLLNLPIVAAAGGSIFDNLSLLFAVGIAFGLAKNNNGAAALSALVGYFVLTSTLKLIDETIDMGVFSGIIIGIVASICYNKWYNIQLPDYLAFFGGKRFVPIITGFLALILGFILGFVWPPIQHGLNTFGDTLIQSGEIGIFSYGFLNRLLIPTGLHHILNSLVWFEFGSYTDVAGNVVRGDLHRFFAGDPSAGVFMAGFFPVMMFGLPGAALAMYVNAKPKNKARVGGLLFSLAFTAFLTGITEPIEFSFMFLSPLLYFIHAILTGLSMVITNLLDIKLGFGFSAGLFDFVINWNLSTNPILAILVGIVYFIIYFFLFNFFIRKFNLATPGRGEEQESNNFIEQTNNIETGDKITNLAMNYLKALGGRDNIIELEACVTRLRLSIKDKSIIDTNQLKKLGAKGKMLEVGESEVQIVVGPKADIIVEKMGY